MGQGIQEWTKKNSWKKAKISFGHSWIPSSKCVRTLKQDVFIVNFEHVTTSWINLAF